MTPIAFPVPDRVGYGPVTPAFRLPLLQQQFTPRDSTSSVDCTAASAGTLANADSLGALAYTHAQVRAATNENPPDWAGSPGLNWTQVDAALLKLSAGKVNLDVHPFGSSFAVLKAALLAGHWAGISVWRGVLVDAGMGGGSTFRAGHAVVVGYDPNHKWVTLGDPLTPQWWATTWAMIEEACAQFIIRAGGGAGATGAYYALTRDVWDVPPQALTYSAVFEPGAFWAYTLSGGTIISREARAFTKATSAPCGPPAVYSGPKYGQRTLVRVDRGSLAGSYVEPGSTHVTLEVHKKP